jgi:O-antigen ligase
VRSQDRPARAVRLARGSVLFVLFLTPVAFYPGSLDSFGLPKLGVLWVGGIIGFGALLISYSQGRTRAPRLQLGRPAGALLAAAFLSTIFSVAPVISLRGMHGRYNGLVTLVLCEAVALVVASQYCGRPSRLRDLMIALAASSALVTLYVVAQANGSDPWGPPHTGALSVLHPAGSMGNSNFAGGMLAVTLPFAVSLAMSAGRRWRRALWLFAAAIQVVAIALTRSRGGLLGGVVALAVVAYVHRRRIPPRARRPVAAIGLALTSLTLVLAVSGTGITKSQSSELLDSQTLEKRLEYWQAAVGVFAAHPVVGTGPDTFYKAYGRHRSAIDGARHGLNTEPPDKPHNIYLEYAADTGALGLAAYLTLLGMTIMYAVARLRHLDGPSRMIVGAFLAALAAYMAQSAVSIDALPLPLIAWASIGAIAAFADPGLANDPDERPPAGRLSRSVAGLIGVALFPLAALITNPLVADHAAKVGQRAGESGDYQGAVQHFRRAMTIDPREANYPYLAGIAQENQARVSGFRSTDEGAFLRQAVALYGRANRLEPGNPFFQKALARSATRLALDADPNTFPTADRAWRSFVASDPTNWEVRAMHADMLASWASAGGGERARASAVLELRRIASMRGLEKRGRAEVTRIYAELGTPRS